MFILPSGHPSHMQLCISVGGDPHAYLTLEVTCASTAATWNLRLQILRLPGVCHVEIKDEHRRLVVAFEPATTDPQALLDAIASVYQGQVRILVLARPTTADDLLIDCNHRLLADRRPRSQELLRDVERWQL